MQPQACTAAGSASHLAYTRLVTRSLAWWPAAAPLYLRQTKIWHPSPVQPQAATWKSPPTNVSVSVSMWLGTQGSEKVSEIPVQVLRSGKLTVSTAASLTGAEQQPPDTVKTPMLTLPGSAVVNCWHGDSYKESSRARLAWPGTRRDPGCLGWSRCAWGPFSDALCPRPCLLQPCTKAGCPLSRGSGVVVPHTAAAERPACCGYSTVSTRPQRFTMRSAFFWLGLMLPKYIMPCKKLVTPGTCKCKASR